jgi:hypothetical protein
MNISDVIYNMLKLTLNQWVEGSSPSGVTSLSSTYRFSSVSAFYFGRALVEQNCKNILQQPNTKQNNWEKTFILDTGLPLSSNPINLHW